MSMLTRYLRVRRFVSIKPKGECGGIISYDSEHWRELVETMPSIAEQLNLF